MKWTLDDKLTTLKSGLWTIKKEDSGVQLIYQAGAFVKISRRSFDGAAEAKRHAKLPKLAKPTKWEFDLDSFEYKSGEYLIEKSSRYHITVWASDMYFDTLVECKQWALNHWKEANESNN